MQYVDSKFNYAMPISLHICTIERQVKILVRRPVILREAFCGFLSSAKQNLECSLDLLPNMAQ
jgi:hypothetical protein